MSATLSYSTGHGKCSVLFAFFKSISICWNSEIDAWTSRHHADVFEVRLMKLNGASDLMLRAIRAKLTLFKSVMFSNYQQKNELSVVSLRQLTCFHCPRMPHCSKQPNPICCLASPKTFPEYCGWRQSFLLITHIVCQPWNQSLMIYINS